jgi:hypothetical protein
VQHHACARSELRGGSWRAYRRKGGYGKNKSDATAHEADTLTVLARDRRIIASQAKPVTARGGCRQCVG